MANVLNRTTKEYLTSVNTPDYPVSAWIINPDISSVIGWPTRYWEITGDTVGLMDSTEREAVDDAVFTGDQMTQAEVDNVHFGDAFDGNVTISSTVTLVQDLYANILTVETGGILNTGGFRVFAMRGIINNGTIRNNGATSTTATGGAGGAAGTLQGGSDGATGLVNLPGVDGGNLNVDTTPGYGGAGGNGGASAGGTVAGGVGGLVYSDAQIRVRPRRFEIAVHGADMDRSVASFTARFSGGAGGGSGGGLIGIAGAGGGGGGGVIELISPYIFNGTTGIISANGGNGANALGSNAGGGGGGGGGLIQLIRCELRNRNLITVNGGTGGSPNLTGSTGQPGASGRILNIVVPRSM